MSDAVYVGMNVGSLETSPAFDPITKIILYVDDETAYVAGTDTGRALEVTCPYGSQDMANNLLEQFSGYAYQPASASDALMDPAAELGDAVTVGSVYTVLASVSTTFDSLMTADISAPGQEEIDSEYPYISQQTSQVNYQLATLRSLITKTSSDITLRVEGLESDYSELKVTIDGVTVSGPGGSTLIKGSSIQTSTLYVDAANISGTLSASQVNLTGSITFSDLSSSVQNDINDAQSTANAAQSAAMDAQDTIDAWTYPGTTRIDGSSIMTGTVTASTLRGGTVDVLTSSGGTAGYISVSGASSYSYAIDIISNGAARLQASYGTLHLEGGAGRAVDIDDNVDVGADLRPSNDNTWYLGTLALRWREVYAASGTIQTSDRQKKKDISYDISGYDAFFDSLKPVSYKFIDGQSGRTHIGMISQDIEDSLPEAGLTSMDFAGFIKGREPKEDGTYDYALRYDEFIGLLVWQVQALKAKVKKLEGLYDANTDI